jgi:hydroxypyruvate isomerase
MAGVPGDAGEDAANDVYLENIRYAVESSNTANVTILIEAISEGAVPGYAIPTLEKAMSVQDIFGADKIALLVDTFHAAVNKTSLPTWILDNGHRIGHVHIADFPGRHEPGTGTIDFDAILKSLGDVRYERAIGFEYAPSTSTIEGVSFLNQWKDVL